MSLRFEFDCLCFAGWLSGDCGFACGVVYLVGVVCVVCFGCLFGLLCCICCVGCLFVWAVCFEWCLSGLFIAILLCLGVWWVC